MPIEPLGFRKGCGRTRLRRELQRAGALQNAPRPRRFAMKAAASWTAVPSEARYRFREQNPSPAAFCVHASVAHSLLSHAVGECCRGAADSHFAIPLAIRQANTGQGTMASL